MHRAWKRSRLNLGQTVWTYFPCLGQRQFAHPVSLVVVVALNSSAFHESRHGHYAKYLACQDTSCLFKSFPEQILRWDKNISTIRRISDLVFSCRLDSLQLVVNSSDVHKCHPWAVILIIAPWQESWALHSNWGICLSLLWGCRKFVHFGFIRQQTPGHVFVRLLRLTIPSLAWS